MCGWVNLVQPRMAINSNTHSCTHAAHALTHPHIHQRQQMGGMPRGAAMPGAPQMYGTVPMMYPGGMPPNGRGPYPMPMMMPGRGVPRGAPMQPGAYQVPAYPGMQQGMPGQQQGGRGRRRPQGQGGRGGARQNQPQAQVWLVVWCGMVCGSDGGVCFGGLWLRLYVSVFVTPTCPEISLMRTTHACAPTHTTYTTPTSAMTMIPDVRKTADHASLVLRRTGLALRHYTSLDV